MFNLFVEEESDDGSDEESDEESDDESDEESDDESGHESEDESDDSDWAPENKKNDNKGWERMFSIVDCYGIMILLA